MDQNDISAILPTEGVVQKHFILNSQILGRDSMDQSSSDFPILSKQFENIYYQKRSMKILLEERSLVCDYLKLKLKPSSQKKIQLDISVDDMQKIIKELFIQCPIVFDPLLFVFIFDCGTAYGFFSGDGKYVPMCKRCNVSCYIVIKNHLIKIVCCNPKCKIKILAENLIQPKNKAQKKTQIKTTKQSSVKFPTEKLDTQKIQVEQPKRNLTNQQLNMIKKTAKKISYS